MGLMKAVLLSTFLDYKFLVFLICLLIRIYYIFRVNDEDVRLMLWDTAGQEEFDAITKAYYRGKKKNPVNIKTSGLW